MPIRFSVILQHLETPNMTYINTNAPQTIDLATGQPIVQNITLGDEVFRHFIFGAEILISKNFNIRVGYNVERRQELSIPNDMGLVGYSIGMGIRVNRFHISYGLAGYSLAGSSNTFTITTNFSDFKQKKNPEDY